MHQKSLEGLEKRLSLLAGSLRSPQGEPSPAVTPRPEVERHVLLIEDSATIRGFLRRIVQKKFPGWVVREAEDGRKAFSEMTSRRVDLIVTDLQMPGMDGQKFLKNLRGNPLLKNKPVLVLSGAITPELQEEFKLCETVRLLAKPSSEWEIAGTMKELMLLTQPPLGTLGPEGNDQGGKG